MKKPRLEMQPIDPADLAAGYMFPELFENTPFSLISQEAEDSPFAPSAAVQCLMPDMPPVDWDHMREKDTERRRNRRHTKKGEANSIRPLPLHTEAPGGRGE